MTRLSIREAIVVEGRYDKNTLSQLVDALKSPRRKNLPFMVSGLCEGAADSLCAALAEDLPGMGSNAKRDHCPSVSEHPYCLSQILSEVPVK